jgi:hypothetical protein
LTTKGVKEEVLRRYHVGQKLTLTIKQDETKENNKIDVKILNFDENFVLTERYGNKSCFGKKEKYVYKESFRYLEFLMMSSRLIEEKKIITGRSTHKCG